MCLICPYSSGLLLRHYDNRLNKGKTASFMFNFGMYLVHIDPVLDGILR